MAESGAIMSAYEESRVYYASIDVRTLPWLDEARDGVVWVVVETDPDGGGAVCTYGAVYRTAARAFAAVEVAAQESGDAWETDWLMEDGSHEHPADAEFVRRTTDGLSVTVAFAVIRG